MITETPSLDECVKALVADPKHPNARYWAGRLVITMDEYVDLGRITLDKRHEYYQLLAKVLYPQSA